MEANPKIAAILVKSTLAGLSRFTGESSILLRIGRIKFWSWDCIFHKDPIPEPKMHNIHMTHTMAIQYWSWDYISVGMQSKPHLENTVLGETEFSWGSPPNTSIRMWSLLQIRLNSEQLRYNDYPPCRQRILGMDQWVRRQQKSIWLAAFLKRWCLTVQYTDRVGRRRRWTPGATDTHSHFIWLRSAAPISAMKFWVPRNDRRS